ncbi:bile acid:sodium symporter family protein [uncultured Pseudokineococcus sp.]|uniref:bile acid:sodium symporter family protein n=1 Tax=uncultured Pseudokineococcus sp. TaxID=1642928 RepID=UPI002617164E|nr:bile acid:sodium symporter family protein [uncultured Pseudokineococcus sp.]
MGVLVRVAGFVGTWFGLLVVGGLVVGLLAPDETATLAPRVPLLLGVIMFGMGLTLRPRDFAVLGRRPRAVAVGVLAQYSVMPLLGWGVAVLLDLDPLLAVGMVLVGASPGGTASNVVVHLARGDVALSVAMTTVSTLLAPVLTPLLVLWLAGSVLEVPASSLVLSILQVVLLPVVAGALVRRLAPAAVERALPLLPLLSVLGIVVVVAAVVGANADAVRSAGLLVLLAVVAHNVLGLAVGRVVGRVTGVGEAASRAVTLEVGMQNSGLAAALATAHFAPLAALPAALFSVWHNISGSALASWWARRPVDAGARPPTAVGG